VKTMSAHIRNKDVLRCLPLLASVLGDQYGVEVRIGGDRAATNGRASSMAARCMRVRPPAVKKLSSVSAGKSLLFALRTARLWALVPGVGASIVF